MKLIYYLLIVINRTNNKNYFFIRVYFKFLNIAIIEMELLLKIKLINKTRSSSVHEIMDNMFEDSQYFVWDNLAF